MPDPLSPEALPGWPCDKDREAEEVTLLACLLGKHVTRHGDKVNEQPLAGVFGHVMLLWEILRHDEKLVELLTKLRLKKHSNDWKNGRDYSTFFAAPIGFIALAPIIRSKEKKPEPLEPWFPDIPFLSLEAKWQNDLVKLFTPGKPAFEIGDIERLDAMGILERFKQLVTLAKEGRQHKQPGARFKQDAILKRENLNPGESVYDATFTIRAHMGIEAARKDFERWLKDNSRLFSKVDTITMRQWEDPRPILRDLAVLRLVRLKGYPGAMAWTMKNRSLIKGIGTYKSDYTKYVGERGKPKGKNPLYDSSEKCRKAVKRALKAIHALKTLPP